MKMISWQTAAHWPHVEAPFPFYLVFYDRGPAGRLPMPAAQGRTPAARTGRAGAAPGTVGREDHYTTRMLTPSEPVAEEFFIEKRTDLRDWSEIELSEKAQAPTLGSLQGS